MSLANGRPYLAIPGPSVVPDRVLQAMHRPAPNIYAGALVEMVAGLWPDLRAVAGTTANVAAYIGNGHSLWEASTANLFSKGDRVLLVLTGHFGMGWKAALEAVGVEVQCLDFGRGVADFGQVEAVLRADTGHRLRAVMATHVDTASSVRTDIPGLRAAMDAAGHPALLMVDCIASLGCDEFRMDDWGVDVTLAASQKGLMTPPGMGFVWFSEKARAAGRSAGLRTPYWDWRGRADGPDFWQHWHGTAPTHHLFGLREALTMLVQEEGMAQVWARHRALAGAVWAAFDAWGAGNPEIRLAVADPASRSCAVTAARIGPSPNATRLRDWCEHKAGVTLGIGLGAEPAEYHAHLRVAHMGHVNAHMTLGALAAMEAAMVALDIPHGSGALSAAAGVIARAVPA